MPEFSGQTTVTSAGSSQRLSASQGLNCAVLVKALPDNTGLVYVGNVAGGVTAATGLPLAAGEAVVFEYVGDLREVWVTAEVDGEGVAWLALAV